MIWGCVYDTINHFVPPPKTSQRPVKLKHIAACKVNDLLEDDDITTDMISELPKSLYKFLFVTGVSEFYLHKFDRSNRSQEVPVCLIELFYSWPFESFNLCELMPYLPPRQRDLCRADSDYMPVDVISENLHCFYIVLASNFCELLMNAKINGCVEGHMKTINLTGYYGYHFNLEPRITVNALRQRQRSSFFSSINGIPKIKVIGSIRLDCLDDIVAFKGITNVSNSKPCADIGVMYHTVRMNVMPESWTDLIKLFIKNETKYLQLPGLLNDCDIIHDICTNLPELYCIEINQLLGGTTPLYQLQELFLPMCADNPLTSVTCFIELYYLTKLSLLNVNLKDQLDPLFHLASGLEYLRLVSCNLDNDDLDYLATSHHVGTLQQLDLGCNKFSDPRQSSEGLLHLIQNLTKIKVLDLQECGLHSWSDEHLGKFMNILSYYSKLVILFLQGNDFSESVLLSNITQLGYSTSLKYIYLPVPRTVLELRQNLEPFKRTVINNLKLGGMEAQQFQVLFENHDTFFIIPNIKNLPP